MHNHFKKILLLTSLIAACLFHSEWMYATTLKVINIKDFGAIPNDNVSDQDAFAAASVYINERKGNVKLIIPKGKYLVGKQNLVKNNNYYYQMGHTLFLTKVKNVVVEGNGAVLQYGLGLRFGSFNPQTGLSTNFPWDCGGLKGKYSEKADIGVCVQIYESQNITINNLLLDGNFYSENLNNMNDFKVGSTSLNNSQYMPNKINLGGGIGDCGIQASHHGILIFHSSDVKMNQIIARRFGTDGMNIANTNEDSNLEFNNCIFDYNARTATAIGGGKNMRFNNCSFTNTGQAHFTATGSGVDLEAEADAKTAKKIIDNVLFNKCTFSNNREGEILAKFGQGSQNITFQNCKINGSRAALIIANNAQNYHFINNNIRGKVVMSNKTFNNINDIKVDELKKHNITNKGSVSK